MQNEERADILSTTAGSVVEGELVDEGMAEAIRRMHARGMGKKRIAREMGLDIKTVRKWLKTEWKPHQRKSAEPALTKYDEWIRLRRHLLQRPLHHVGRLVPHVLRQLVRVAGHARRGDVLLGKDRLQHRNPGSPMYAEDQRPVDDGPVSALALAHL